MEFELSEEYVTYLFQSNEKFSITSLHTLNICCALEPLLTFGIPSNDTPSNSDFFSICPIKMGRYLSFPSLLPSVTIPCHVIDIISFRSLAVWLEIDSINMLLVFIRPFLYLLAIFESGNIAWNNLPAWSAVAMRRLCSTKKPAKSSSDFVNFWSKLAVAVIALQLVNFFFILSRIQKTFVFWSLSYACWCHFHHHYQC